MGKWLNGMDLLMMVFQIHSGYPLFARLFSFEYC